MSTLTEKAPPNQGEKFQERHLAKGPEYTHALCGKPRGERALHHGLPKDYVTCVVCRDLAGLA